MVPPLRQSGRVEHLLVHLQIGLPVLKNNDRLGNPGHPGQLVLQPLGARLVRFLGLGDRRRAQGRAEDGAEPQSPLRVVGRHLLVPF